MFFHTCSFHFVSFVHTDHHVLREPYNLLLESISNKINETESNVQRLVSHILSKFAGEIPGIQLADIPLNPNKKDFRGVQFWKEETWLAIQAGSAANDTNSPTYSLWMEDRFGNPILHSDPIAGTEQSSEEMMTMNITVG